jgi:hypothetical protein
MEPIRVAPAFAAIHDAGVLVPGGHMRIGSRWRGVALAIALAAIGGASTCSNEPTAPLTLDGTFTMVAVDGHSPPAVYDPQSLVDPPVMITSVTAEFVAPDSVWVTTNLSSSDVAGRSTIAAQHSGDFYMYTRTGDSLHYIYGDASRPFGAIAGNTLHLHIWYPTPPSEGGTISHEYSFAK